VSCICCQSLRPSTHPPKDPYVISRIIEIRGNTLGSTSLKGGLTSLDGAVKLRWRNSTTWDSSRFALGCMTTCILVEGTLPIVSSKSANFPSRHLSAQMRRTSARQLSWHKRALGVAGSCPSPPFCCRCGTVTAIARRYSMGSPQCSHVRSSTHILKETSVSH